MACCYILYSNKIDRFYIGATKGTATERLSDHLSSKYGTFRFTAQTNDWEIFLEIETIDYSQALRMEKKIKSMKSRKYINNLKLIPELRQRLQTDT